MQGDRLNRRTYRWLDVAIRVALVAIVALVAWLGYLYWANSQTQAVSSPSGRAIENLRAIVKASPANPDARIKLAEAFAYAGRLSEAIEQYNAALQIKPDYSPALSGLATIAMKQKDFKTAENYWLKVVSLLDNTTNPVLSPALDEAYYGLGVTYIEMKRYEDAVGALKQAARIKTQASDTHYMLSVAYRELGFPDKQKEELQITLAFDPNNAQANYDLGLVALAEKDLASAAELFRIAATSAPAGVKLPQQELDKLAAAGSAAQRLSKARALVSKDPAAALFEARVAAALDPTSVDAVRLVATLWDSLGNKERALNAYRRIVELVSTDPAAEAAIKRLSADAK
jgi:tetratricopeptide (TPR) repeat protein